MTNRRGLRVSVEVLVAVGVWHSAEYRYSQPREERRIRDHQRHAQLSVVPSGRSRGAEIDADREQPPHALGRSGSPMPTRP